jgi:hypothetical protein
MRHPLVVSAVAVLGSVFGSIAVAGCSGGSTAPDLFEEAGTIPRSPPITGDTPPDQSEPPRSNNGGGNNSGNPNQGHDAGTNPTHDASSSSPSDGGVDCTGVPRETESNDSMTDANAFTKSICADVAGSDVDWLTFTLPVGTKNFNLNYDSFGTGTLDFKMHIAGATLDILKPNSPGWPIVPGEKYAIEVSTSGNHTAYRLNLTIIK